MERETLEVPVARAGVIQLMAALGNCCRWSLQTEWQLRADFDEKGRLEVVIVG
jgi:hypothetical protein